MVFDFVFCGVGGIVGVGVFLGVFVFKEGGRNSTEPGEGGAGKNLGVRGGKKHNENPLYEKELFQ